VQSSNTATISVIDFRRGRMVLDWHTADGTWAASDTATPLMHGIALIRASQPNICVYGLAGQLYFQAGADRFALEPDSPRLICASSLATCGLRRRFGIQGRGGETLFSVGYWSTERRDFFRWLAARAADAQWRAACGRLWSEGVPEDALRAEPRPSP
jgi:hypothetical protein